MKDMLWLVGTGAVVVVGAACVEIPTVVIPYDASGFDCGIECLPPPQKVFTVKVEGTITVNGTPLPSGTEALGLVCKDCVTVGEYSTLCRSGSPPLEPVERVPTDEKGHYSISVGNPVLSIGQGEWIAVERDDCPALNVHFTLPTDGREAYVPWGGICSDDGGENVVDYDFK